MNEGQELVEEPKAELSVTEQCEADIVAFEDVNAELKFEIETFDGETECKKYLAKLRKVYNRLERKRKEVKQPHLDKGTEVDSEFNSMKDRVDVMHDVHSVPLKALETKRVNEVLAQQEALKADARRIQDEKDAELEKLREIVAKQEADAKAVEDAANAEAATRRIQEQATKEAERKAQSVIDAAAKKAADKYAKEQAEQERIAEANRKRIANQEHRREFNSLAAEKLTVITGDLEMSIAIVTAIVRKEIDNIYMKY